MLESTMPIESESQATEPLFSYGTLQQDDVQRATFGRQLETRPDELPGYRLGSIEIHDAAVVATSGKAHHPIISRSDGAADRVRGSLLMLTAEELRQADAYEVADYRRARVTLASGVSAWAYVDARE
jgi:gamma-glutamylcyclotransferase (GGCT)/AIG2-like uncharacterized protein YtfP